MPNRILLAEDEALQREALAELLGDAGFDVSATCTADEAVILIADGQEFDLLLTDIAVPGDIDGLGLAMHAREVQPGLPLVFISGQPPRASALRDIGDPLAFVAKPLIPAALVHLVQSLIPAETELC